MTQVYKVQLSMNQRHLVDSGLTFKQGDFGFQIEIEVLDFDVTGVSPQIIFRKSIGAVESTSITVSGNKFTYTMAGTELDTPGPAICDLKLKNSTTQRISTASFRYYVEADTMDGLNQQASSYSDTIEQVLAGYENDIKDHCLSNLVSDYGEITLNKYINYANGGTGNTNGLDVITANTFPGEKFIYTLEQTVGGVIGLAFYNLSGTYISGVSGYAGTGRKEVTAPANAAMVKATVFHNQNNAFVYDSTTGEVLAKVGDSVLKADADTHPSKWSMIDLVYSNQNKFYNGVNNAIEDFTGLKCTDYIDISQYKVLKFCGVSFATASAIAILDSDKNQLLKYPASSYYDYHDLIINVPSNAKYCIINNTNDVAPTYGDRYISHPRLLASKNIGVLDLYGKKWIVLGDSLTEQAPNGVTLMGYYDYISNLTGIDVYNMGVSGTGYMNYSGQTFRERALNMPTGHDVITIFGSGNDIGKGYTLGNPDDSGTSTLCGCINATIDNIYSIDPTIKLGIITPTPWRGYPPTTANNEMELYANAIIAICKRRSIPCLDLYHSSGLRPWDDTFKAYAFDDIGVHPNAEGHKYIASQVKEFLNSLLIGD